MHALGQHLDCEHAVHQTTQRSRPPQLVVIAAARVEPQHQCRRANARREQFEIRRQVVAAAFLAALDQHRNTRVRPAGFFQAFERSQGAEHGIAVIGAPAAIQLAVFNHGGPRSQALAPAGHLRLFVEMTVDQNCFALVAVDFDVKHRGATSQPYNLELHPG